MDMSPTALMMSLLLGTIGMGLFIYGKKQQQIAHLVAGVGLMVIPYFIANIIALIVVGVVLTAAPFYLGSHL
jgi:hypothetical protein